ncbi:hypothetical protein BDA99DRAFT_536060 [Phascolomyces articulosus]|uniref:Uncharacterized protein n=1 Tax=Phascolomyces articulosus TaxID=60185 RepID=A0AAD5KCH8_9FUNG|nr:hypothetical protein BDA99DRAFT_536060 [Phascolomyces articulosus]
MSPTSSVAIATTASQQFPPTPQSTPRNSSSSSALPRFSVNSNLMNYSIPKNDPEDITQQKQKSPSSQSTSLTQSSSITTHPADTTETTTTSERREIRRGNSSTRTRQLENQIESLTLQNVKLQRTNRLLKVDTDNLIKQKTQPLQENIRDLTLANVQLQRATRLLQQDLEEKTTSLENFKQEQIMQMKSVGPEYEYLVQMVNLLHRQISGNPTCDETCCFTQEPISQSTMVMTLPPENEQQDMEAQHICRPIVHSSISQGSYAMELENKILRLEQVIEELDTEKEQMLRQQTYKDNDIETLKRELRIKDDIVSQLEGDFLNLEEQLARLQQELNERRDMSYREGSIRPQPAPQPRGGVEEQKVHDPKRQSQLLMATKRRSLAIKDTEALERMLRGDLQQPSSEDEASQPMISIAAKEEHHQQQQDEENEDDDSEDGRIEDDDDDDDNASTETDQDTNMTTPPRSTSPRQPFDDEVMVTKSILSSSEKQPIQDRRRVLSFLSCGVLPCAYPTEPSQPIPKLEDNDPFAPFTLMTIFLGLAAQMGITDDWTVPITLAALVSGFLWSGAAKGVQLKLKFK